MRASTGVNLYDELNWFFVIMFETQRELGCSKSYFFFFFLIFIVETTTQLFYTLNILFFGKILYFNPNPNLPSPQTYMNLNKLK